MRINEDYLLEVLTRNGVLDSDSMQHVINISREYGVSIAQATEQAKIMSADDVMMMLAAEYGLETVKLDQFKITRSVIQHVPCDIAERYNIVPLCIEDEKLTIAIADPADIQLFDTLSHLLKLDIEGVIASIDDIKTAFNTYYKLSTLFSIPSMR